MAYRKLGRTNKHRRSMLANLTKEVIDKIKEMGLKFREND